MQNNWADTNLDEKLSFLHQKVEVKLLNGKTEIGWVYTVDPIGHSIVILKEQKLTTIFGHSVKSVTIIETPTKEIKEKLENLLEFDQKTYKPEFLQQRRLDVHTWFTKNRIPVEIIGEKLRVANVVDVGPPYNAESCSAPNEIILTRIQKLIGAMPQS
uniref:gem-associated protein 6-like n=1 Tax=Ciona intestinalis TaxID=7719 RepID=UPI000180BF55|nr:gem-associated protein 6-like [Ciona intestinalis]|eukprot:XP_002123595.1 gem-associated protein 6-like [Ciona intestinalis]